MSFHFYRSSALIDPLLLSILGEYDRNRKGSIQHVARWRQFPGSRVDAKRHDVARILIRRNQKLSGGIDGKVARRLALRGGPIDKRQRAALRIDAKDHNGIVSTVRPI